MDVLTMPEIVPGVVRGGVVVPTSGTLPPEGTEVGIVTAPHAIVQAKKPRTFIDGDGNPVEMTAEEIKEFEAWESLDAEAMSSIDWGEGEIAREEG